MGSVGNGGDAGWRPAGSSLVRCDTTPSAISTCRSSRRSRGRSDDPANGLSHGSNGSGAGVESAPRRCRRIKRRTRSRSIKPSSISRQTSSGGRARLPLRGTCGHGELFGFAAAYFMSVFGIGQAQTYAIAAGRCTRSMRRSDSRLARHRSGRAIHRRSGGARQVFITDGAVFVDPKLDTIAPYQPKSARVLDVQDRACVERSPVACALRGNGLLARRRRAILNLRRVPVHGHGGRAVEGSDSRTPTNTETDQRSRALRDDLMLVLCDHRCSA